MIRFILRYPRAIIGVVSLLTAFFAYGLSRGLILDVSPLGFSEQGSPERANFEAARRDFGPDDYMVVAVVCDDVFAPENLARLRGLHDRIAKIKGVAEILSLANVPYARSTQDGASLEMLLPQSFENAARVQEARRVATGDRLFVGNLVSADGRTAAFNILLDSRLPTPERHTITSRIYDEARGAGFAASFFAGDPFSQWRGTQAIQKDLQVFLPLTFLLVILLLWICFRSLSAVVLPMLTIGIGLVWLFGLMAFLNAPFTILALMLPTLMLAIGCSYMIHVVNQIGIVNDMRGVEVDRAAVLEEAMRFISLPVIVSALTIIAGFLSLSFSNVPTIRASAVYSAIGAAFTMVLSLTFIPATLMLVGRRAMAFRVGLHGKMVHLLESTGRWATTHQRLLYVVTLFIVLASMAGMRRIVIEVDYFHYFKPNTEPVIGLNEIGRRLSGTVTFDIIVEGKGPGAVETSAALTQIASYQQWLEEYGRRPLFLPGGMVREVDQTLSAADFIKHVNRAFHNNDPAFAVIPADDREIGELLSDRDQLRSFMTRDGRSARILVRSNLTRSQDMARVIRLIEEQGRTMLPGFRVYATGTFVLLNRTSDMIGGEQVQSVTIALVTIFLMLALLFKSVRVGFTALVPNLIPVVFFFGFMGWRGIPLNLTTSLVASVVLGLAVDNAVQFIVRFRRAQRETPELRDAIIESMRLSGRPIIYANIALAATFAIFTVSNFWPIASFGLLSAVTIMGCLVEDLVLLPARLTSPVFRVK
ncbi:MAG: efflux RND transporter permease subunit [Blastocatellia bacterium]|nr:efflux RND transporter permease subunit [Blastocatellia bacterium]